MQKNIWIPALLFMFINTWAMESSQSPSKEVRQKGLEEIDLCCLPAFPPKKSARFCIS